MNFIAEYPRALSAADCERLIALFEKSSHYHNQASLWVEGKRISDPVIKDDTEITITDELLQNDSEWAKAISPALAALKLCSSSYQLQFPTVNKISSWALEAKGFNMQKFSPGQGYKDWHCEVASKGSPPRMLVWSAYLNTMTDLGGTDFFYQKFTCKAEQGKIVLWPPFWTHFHRSQVSPTETKYILTGWMTHT